MLCSDVAGAMDYVIVDTDYETYGLVCTCQVTLVNLWRSRIVM